jgi:N6-adenosine-specific RNA methylase IME4
MSLSEHVGLRVSSAVLQKELELFRTVVLDPPWLERGGGKSKRGADRHYPLMKWPEIVRSIHLCPHWGELADNVHMYMWATNNHLCDALRVIEALGFRYVTNVVWMKDRVGLGQYFRGQHEILLFATRGKRPTEPRTEAKNIPSVIRAPRRAHSQKPDEAFDMIERRSRGPYLEMFARARRGDARWTEWGNEL